MHNIAMRLQEFMDKAGCDDAVVAEAVGCDRSTISRLRRGAVERPAAKTLLMLDRWAESVRQRKRWPARFRLSWDHLLPDTERSDGGVAA